MQIKTKRTGLYIHIPFCAQKCHYCDFTITTQHSGSHRQRFFAALEKEIAYYARHKELPVFETIYLGGGTPSLLTGSETQYLFDLLKKNFSFSAEAEITCEVNPGDLDEAKVKIFQNLGVNRISLGLQSLDEQLLKTLGRSHGAEDVRRTVDLLHRLKFENISMDLMICLPGQSLKIFEKTLAEAVAFIPKQITLYDLEVFPNTYFGKLDSNRELLLPGESEHAAMYSTAEGFLSAQGYHHYELSSFAQPGFESRHNLLYWKNQNYLGLGPGAHSHMDGKRFVLSETVGGYLKKCEGENFTCEFEEEATPAEREIEQLITGLRLLEGIDLQDFSIIRKELEENSVSLIDSGLIQLKNNRMQLTIRGQFLAEEVFASLLP